MSDPQMPHDLPPKRSLPPVEAPNARLIVQLFLVPLILVLLVIGLIVLLFGGLGAGPQTPREFVDGLNSPSEIKKWKTAQDLAQVLPRNPALRQDVDFALRLTELLDRERRRPPPGPSDQPVDANAVPDLLEYLPAAVGSFNAPVGVPILQEVVEQNERKQQDAGHLIRFRNGLLALGLLGARLHEFDGLSEESKQAIVRQLDANAGEAPGKATWAKLAQTCLNERMKQSTRHESSDVFNLLATLRLGAESKDEFTRKITIVALANWQVPGVDQLLFQLTGDQSDLKTYENADHQRGQREIRFNAALALARRASPLTPWPLVLEALDEQRLLGLYAKTDNAAPVSGMLVVALGAVKEGRKRQANLFEAQPELLSAVRKLQESSNAAVRMEADKLLGSHQAETVQPGHFSRQVLLMAGMALGVFLLLGLAVFKRWQRAATSAS